MTTKSRWLAVLRNGRWTVERDYRVFFQAATLTAFEAKMVARKLNRLEDLVEIAFHG